MIDAYEGFLRFLSSRLFRFLILPALTAGLGVLLKAIVRRHSSRVFQRSDAAVGMELGITALLLCVLQTVALFERYERLERERAVASQRGDTEEAGELADRSRDVVIVVVTSMVLLFAIFVGLLIVALVWRYAGWVTSQGRQTPQVHLWWGMLFPNLAGLCFLTAVMLVTTEGKGAQ